MTTQTDIIQTPDFIPTLASTATLVWVMVRLPSFSVGDKQVTDQVIKENNAQKKAGRYVKNLMVGNPQYDALVNSRAAIATWLTSETFDWAASLQLLPGVRRACFMKAWHGHYLPNHKRLIEEFLLAYPDAIAAQAFVHGATFKREDYPTVEELRNSRRFDIDLYEQEIPAGDFRNQFTIDAVNDAVTDLKRQANRVVQDMVERQIEDFAKVVNSLAEACRVTPVIKEDGSVKMERGRLYETTFTKALDYCDLLDTFNVSGDPRLDELRSTVRKILGDVSVEKLREGDTLRTRVKEELDDLKSKFGF